MNSPVNWALLGYEGQTNVLKLVSKGEDGVEEMTEDLNPSKIMYGFLSIEDPKTSLPKFVIINWQVMINCKEIINTTEIMILDLITSVKLFIFCTFLEKWTWRKRKNSRFLLFFLHISLRFYI